MNCYFFLSNSRENFTSSTDFWSLAGVKLSYYKIYGHGWWNPKNLAGDTTVLAWFDLILSFPNSPICL